LSSNYLPKDLVPENLEGASKVLYFIVFNFLIINEGEFWAYGSN
tara:strand:- start:1628 stop:1759 length:132 start_codon:yes stop_codon:yes gene_type:complete